LTRHIGVSNFTVALIEEAVAKSAVPLICNQVEYHPYLEQTKVLAACRAHDLALVAYSPVAKGRVKNAEALSRIGARYGKTAAQSLPALADPAGCCRHSAHVKGRASFRKSRDFRFQSDRR
jgi:diketogulonate reductase-like aldo/keto reductase